MLQPPMPLSLCTLALTLLLSGCLTAPKQPPIDPSPFETLEYQGQKGLAVIHASSLYARGGTGQGVAVALVDSGLNSDLPEFQGRVANPVSILWTTRLALQIESVMAPRWPVSWRPTKMAWACMG